MVIFIKIYPVNLQCLLNIKIKNMKKIELWFIAMLVTATATATYAQNTFFPTKAGTVLTYANKDAKGKASSYTRLTIKTVEGSGNNFSITYAGEALDSKQKPVSDPPMEISYTVTVNNGVVEWDMKTFAAPGTEGFIEIEGDKLRIPPTLSPGDKLNDVKFTMTINMGFKIRTEIELTDQQCLAIEDVTVPAGTFKCHKVTQKSTATVMRKSTVSKSVSWFAPGTGTVKTETYDAKDKLQGSTELIELKN